MSARIAILCDFSEEHWPSMELVAEMLARELRENHSDQFDVTMLRPVMKWRFSRIGGPRIVDRLVNRMWDYPRWLRKRVDQFDLFHLADHSYSQLVHELPPERTGVFCHDLDTFRCLLDPRAEPRPRWFRGMARRILEGMQKARVVFHTTETVREQILKHGLIDPARLVKASYGIAPEFSDVPADDNATPDVAGHLTRPFLLHVGSCIPRKRIDVLLEVFANVSKRHADLTLIQVGGEWTPAQREQISRLQIQTRLVALGRQPRPVIAELYRRAHAVLMPSEAEGFGLPVAEALACGAIVVASDIPVLREVGADAAIYCPLADVNAWSDKIDRILTAAEDTPCRSERLARAAMYSWREHARIIAKTYMGLESSRKIAINAA